MNINRHNYETFFLLYVDNELSAAERKAVEEFVRVNTDLKPELESFLETTLPGETIIYAAPEGLYKNEIDLDSLQENLLLNLDNELDATSKKEIAEKIFSDEAVKKEWQIWEQTKLDASEKIIFKDKQLLYRHEGSRVIAIRFWRIAAAAILLIGLFTGISLWRKDKLAENAVAVNEIKSGDTKQPVKNNTSGTTNNTAAASEKSATSVNAENMASAESGTLQQERNVTSTTSDKNGKSPVEKNNIAVTRPEKSKKEIVEKRSLENINKEKSNEIIASTVLSNRNNEVPVQRKATDEIATTESIKDKISAPAKPFIDYNSVSAMPESYAKTAGFTEGTSENNNKIFYVNEETVTRSKVGGLFRKVKRVIERNTNIKTGNGVKIAGFEIALK